MSASENAGDGAQRPPEEIEREIAGTRAALESTVEELGERLRPGPMAEEARSYVKEKAARSAEDAWHGVQDTLRENPWWVILGGGGVGVLLAMRHDADGAVERRRSAWVRNGRSWSDAFLGRPSASGLSARAASAGALASDLGAQATERALALASRLRESGAGARAQHQLERARHDLEKRIDEQPLLLGLAGFAVGVLLSGALARRRS